MSGASVALGRRIAGAKDLSSVVRSMRALAASNIVQYEHSVVALQDYYRTVELGLSVCLHTADPQTNVLHGSRPLVRGAVVFGSDQGLVGRFNEVMMEFAARTLHALPGKTTHVWAVGERMQELVRDASFPSPTTLAIPNSVGAISSLVEQLLIDIATPHARHDIDEIYVFHNQPLGAGGYRPVGKRLLPLDSRWQREVAALPWPTKALPQTIDGSADSLDCFIREYLFVLLFQACAESLASENASRLAAMQRAEDNIAQILDELSRCFRRMRQESIDEELFEVVSGYEALSQPFS